MSAPTCLQRLGYWAIQMSGSMLLLQEISSDHRSIAVSLPYTLPLLGVILGNNV